ncbi:MAG: hypothetical protein DSY42_06295 [Aquifex sp.]|nr:MAG: hypothetical protein DSY42_06295 [Aquifex sp.]
MKKVLLASAVFAFTTSSFAQEITLKLSQALELYGGFSAGYFYTTNENSKDSQDKFQITNAIIGIKGETGESIKLGFDLAIGGSLWSTVFDGGQGDLAYIDSTNNELKEGVGILWGYATLKPHPAVSIDAGVLTTNVGYELADTYSNPNITFGAVWNAQPFIYPGVRLTLSPMENVDLYVEYNQEYQSDNFAFGILGETAGVSFALNYYDYRENKNLVDVVLGYSIANIDLGLNFDYQWLDDSAKTQGQDDSAYGVAIYFIPNFDTSYGKVSLPIRLEYFNEGTSGIYYGGADTGYTFTITPTIRPTSNTFVRAEAAYVTTDNKVFKNNTKDNKTTFAFEMGFTF